MPLKYHIFENIIKDGAFALWEQMLHFFKFSKVFKTENFSLIFSNVTSKNRKLGHDLKRVKLLNPYNTLTQYVLLGACLPKGASVFISFRSSLIWDYFVSTGFSCLNNLVLALRRHEII